MGRLFVVSLIWLGILGTAEPVLACAMNSPVSACCSTDLQTSCSDRDSGPAAALGNAHQQYCTAAPIGDLLAVSIHANEAKLAPGSENLPIIAPPVDDWFDPSAAAIHRPRFSRAARSCGASTYLRTGRLRL